MEGGRLVFAPAFYTPDEIKKILKPVNDYNNSQVLFRKSDSAVGLVYLGKYNEALKVFYKIEKEFPGEYNTAANIGTIYELLGKNDSALHWINKAIKINPASHDGSEWIHIKILEAKIKAAKQADGFLNAYNVLGLDWGDSLVPVLKKSAFTERDIMFDLLAQLNERLKFIKPKEPIMARLFFDFGNACAYAQDFAAALAAYTKAEEFGYNTPQFKKWIAYFKTQPASNNLNKTVTDNNTVKIEQSVKPDNIEDSTQSKGPSTGKYIVLIVVALVMVGAVLANKFKKKN